jgi:pimeloyl-ACP methyl ester carboxylesterase
MRALTFLTTLLLFTQLAGAQTTDTASFKSFDGTKIFYDVKGDGEPVILIHGFIVTSDSWKNAQLYNDLLSSGFRVVTLDLRGNGRSGKPHDPEAYENDAEAMDVMILADRLGFVNYSVIGYSRGAIIASRLLVKDKRVKAAVLGGMGADFTDPKWPRRQMFYKALIGESVPELEGLVKRVKDDPALDRLALAYMQKGQPSTTQAEFKKNKIPVLVICGDKDEDNGSSKDLAGLIPGSTYKRVPGVHNDAARSQEFSSETIVFLRGIK